MSRSATCVSSTDVTGSYYAPVIPAWEIQMRLLKLLGMVQSIVHLLK